MMCIKFKDLAVVFLFYITFLSLILLIYEVPSIAQSSELMNFQSKIVNKSDGTNISSTTPCVATNTCDFRVSIYDAQTGGNLKWQEVHENVPILATSGIFNLRLNSVCNSWIGSPTPPVGCTATPTVTGINWSTNPTLWIELQFSPAGDNTWTETFTRQRLNTVPFAYYSDTAGSLNGLNQNNFVQTQPSTSQIITGTSSNPLINLNYTGSGTPPLASLKVAGVERFQVTNSGNLMVASNSSNGSISLGNGSNNILSTSAASGNSSSDLYWGDDKVCIESGIGCPDSLYVKLTNTSGVNLLAGSVVVRDDSNDNSFTTTTIQNDPKVLGVLAENCSNGSLCRVAVSGKATVNLISAASRGMFVRASNTAGYGIATSSSTTNGLLGVTISEDNTSPYAVEILLSKNLGGGLNAVLEDSVFGSIDTPVNLSVYGDVLLAGEKQIVLSGVDIVEVRKWDTTNLVKSVSKSWVSEVIDSSGKDCNISTHDRCGNPEIPLTAWVVATTNSVMIFDGIRDQMWMKFEVGPGKSIEGNVTALDVLRDAIYIGTKGSANSGLFEINFSDDKVYKYNELGKHVRSTSIAYRNSSGTYTLIDNAYMIFSNNVNDVDAKYFENLGYNSRYIAIATEDAGSVVLTLDSDVRFNTTTTVINPRSSGVASSNENSSSSGNVFDYNPLTSYSSTSDPDNTPVWISYKMAYPKAVNSYSVVAPLFGLPMMPKNWTFEGSHDGSNWFVLDTRTNEVGWTAAESRTYSFVNNQKYKNYRIRVTSNNAVGALLIGDLRFDGIGNTFSYSHSVGSSYLNAFDSDLSTNWDAGVDPTPSAPVWLAVVHTNPLIFQRYAIGGNQGGRMPRDWTIEASNDFINWTVLDTRTGVTWAPPGTNDFMSFSFSNSIGYRFYRIRITDNNTSGSLLLGMITFEDMMASSVYLGVPNHGIVNTMDGDVNTYYASKAFDGFPQNFYFHNPGKAIINSYSWYVHAGLNDRAPKDWNFYGSNDGSNWDLLDTRSNVTSWDGEMVFYLPPDKVGNYSILRFEINQVNGGNWILCSEIKFLLSTRSVRYDIDVFYSNHSSVSLVSNNFTGQAFGSISYVDQTNKFIGIFHKVNEDKNVFQSTPDFILSTSSTPRLLKEVNEKSFLYSESEASVTYTYDSGFEIFGFEGTSAPKIISTGNSDHIVNEVSPGDFHLSLDARVADDSDVNASSIEELYSRIQPSSIIGSPKLLKSPHTSGLAILPRVGSGAIYFDGIDQIKFPHYSFRPIDVTATSIRGTSSLSLSNKSDKRGWSVASWVWVSGSSNANGRAFLVFEHPTPSYTTEFTINGSNYSLQVKYGSTTWIPIGGISLTPNQWIHVAVSCVFDSYDSFGGPLFKFHFYINGEFKAKSSRASNSCGVYGENIAIGRGTAVLDGAIDDLFIFDSGALTPAQVRMLYFRALHPVVSATSNTLTFNNISGMAKDELAGYAVEIVNGTGAGQIRIIKSNTSNQFTFTQNWQTTPDNTSTFRLLATSLPMTGGSFEDSQVRYADRKQRFIGINDGANEGEAVLYSRDRFFVKYEDLLSHENILQDDLGNVWQANFDNILFHFAINNKAYVVSEKHVWIQKSDSSIFQSLKGQNQSIKLVDDYSSGKDFVIRVGKKELPGVTETILYAIPYIQKVFISYGIIFDSLPTIIWSTSFTETSNLNDEDFTHSILNEQTRGFEFQRGVGRNCSGCSVSLAPAVLHWMAIGPSSQISGSGADLAENYLTYDKTLEAGDVVSIDSAKDVAVKKASIGDQRAIGIIATKPAIVIGNTDGTTEGVKTSITGEEVRTGQAKTVPVALAGRVPVKVTLENGPIKRGDFLTVSSIKPGYAAKAIKPGVTIGRALEEFDGTNTVLGILDVKNSVSLDQINDLSKNAVFTSSILVDALEKLNSGSDELGESKMSEGKIMAFVQTGYYWGELSESQKVTNGESSKPLDTVLTAQSSKSKKIPDLVKKEDKLEEAPNFDSEVLSLDEEKTDPSQDFTAVAINDFISSEEQIFTVDKTSKTLVIQNIKQVRMFDKKFIFDSYGNFTAKGTVSAKNLEVVGDRAGSAVIRAGESEVKVSVSGLKSSDIVLTSVVSENKIPIYVKIDEAGQSFMIKLSESVAEKDVEVLYVIISRKENFPE